MQFFFAMFLLKNYFDYQLSLVFTHFKIYLYCSGIYNVVSEMQCCIINFEQILPSISNINSKELSIDLNSRLRNNLG